MLNTAPLSLALLNHLGIHLIDALEADPWGDPEEVTHVFGPAALVGDLLDFSTIHAAEYRLRVFEGAPPPF